MKMMKSNSYKKETRYYMRILRKGNFMKKQIKLMACILAAVTLVLLITEFCTGQTEEEKAYYYNPDIISNRLQREKAAEEAGIILYKNAKIVFAQAEEARDILTTKDEYINSLTDFDRRIRLNKTESVSEKEHLDFLSEQVLAWSENEKARVESMIINIVDSLKDYNLNLPAKIMLIKTTGKEEGQAAYCRGNAIIIPKNILDQQSPNMERLIVHELFHIFTKNNLQTRETLYSIINFHKCEKAELPRRITDIELTNPDVPKERYYIELEHDGRNIKVIPILTLPNFDVKRGMPFFSYLRLKLVEVEKNNNEYIYKRDNSGQPVMYDQRQLSDYLKKVGNNTSYLIHPEEILADNFTIMVLGNQPAKSKWVIDKMQSVLENKNPEGVVIRIVS